MKYLLFFILTFQIGCVTMLKKPKNKHYFCTKGFFDDGMDPETANNICRDIWRTK